MTLFDRADESLRNLTAEPIAQHRVDLWACRDWISAYERYCPAYRSLNASRIVRCIQYHRHRLVNVICLCSVICYRFGCDMLTDAYDLRGIDDASRYSSRCGLPHDSISWTSCRYDRNQRNHAPDKPPALGNPATHRQAAVVDPRTECCFPTDGAPHAQTALNISTSTTCCRVVVSVVFNASANLAVMTVRELYQLAAWKRVLDAHSSTRISKSSSGRLQMVINVSLLCEPVESDG